MKTLTLDVIKKNRVYFKCKTENGYEVKLKVSQKTDNLQLGKQELLVRDCSVRTKYGTDIIYDLEAALEKNEIITLQHKKYNKNLVEKCKALGGKWDADSKSWVFPKIVEDEVEKLDEEYNCECVDVQITAKEELFAYQSALHFLGYPLCQAYERDSGAKICEHVSLISGKASSAGSRKNWGTEITEGTTFRLEIPKNLLEKAASEKWIIKVLNNGQLEDRFSNNE